MNQAEDVEVVLNHDRRYKFHSGVLARNSTLMASMLTERSAAKLSNKAKNAGIRLRWLVALVELPGDKYPAGKLELIRLDAMGEPLDRFHVLIPNENGRIPTRAFHHYESIFYAFYNHELAIADEDMSAALEDALSIIDIAEYMGCIPLISKPIDVALVKHGQNLFSAIQRGPWGWVGLANRIRSELIFKEAIVHLAGNWRMIKMNKTAMDRLRDFPAQVRELCEKHHRILIQKGKRVELAVTSLYPGGMATPSTDLPIKRDEYAKDVLVWMALTFFRHWIGQRIISEKGSAGPDGGYELYSQLGQAGEAYMDKTIINQFHNKFPMTKKAMNVLENHLLEIKECMKGVVDEHGILKSACQLDTHRYPVDYLTCVEVQKEELPWDVEEDELRRANAKSSGMRPGGNEIIQRNLAAAKLHAKARKARLEGEGSADDEEEEEMDEESENGYGYDESPSKRARHG